MASAISIEETNRLRVSLGMKPLPVPGESGPVFKEASSPKDEEDEGSTLESREAQGYENYRKVREAEEAKRKREERNEALKKARDAAKRFSKLEGKGLADDDDDMDAKSWLLKQKKRQKEIEKARKKQQELEEAEAAAAAQYTAKDLAGVKVGHEFSAFTEGEDQILTLKDSTIEQNDEEGDELENLDLREKERLEDKLELKKKKPTYNPNEVDESGEASILAQYDEEIDGKKQKRFTLDGSGNVEERSLVEGGAQKAKPKTISLDILSAYPHIPQTQFVIFSLLTSIPEEEPKPDSDYLDISEIKVKKPKKKKSKSTRQKAVDEDDIFPSIEQGANSEQNGAMELDQPVEIPKKRSFQDISFVDDDDLQSSLAAQRREALKKRKRVRPEDLAQQLREEASATPAAAEEEEPAGLVIDETSEFVSNLQKPTAPEPRRRSTSRQAEPAVKDESDEEGDINMERSYADIEDEQERLERLKREKSTSVDLTVNGLEEEATLDRGLGSTLKLLKERGILKPENTEDLNEVFRRKQLFLAEKQRREAEAERKARAQRERDRATGRLDRMSAREKEEYARSQNMYRDQQESRLLAEHFNKEYKPNVELKYVDEFGRHMNQKEAFKHLSHQFHGKGSGKQKTEKMLKKIEDEKRREAKSALDGSQMGGMSGVTSQQLKKQRQAGVRLA